MLTLKTKEEIELIRESALIVSKTLGMLAGEVKPGVSTLQLDALAETFIRDHGAIPGFLGMYDFPNTLCMSPNEQVVHGHELLVRLDSYKVYLENHTFLKTLG